VTGVAYQVVQQLVLRRRHGQALTGETDLLEAEIDLQLL
jgi:hypothetical protein